MTEIDINLSTEIFVTNIVKIFNGQKTRIEKLIDFLERYEFYCSSFFENFFKADTIIPIRILHLSYLHFEKNKTVRIQGISKNDIIKVYEYYFEIYKQICKYYKLKFYPSLNVLEKIIKTK